MLPRNEILQPVLPENASVKVIGLGGVGSIVARYAAVFLASLGRNATLTLIDGDSFEPSNASRMLFGACGNKAKVVREELLPRFKDSFLTLLAVEEYVTEENAARIIQENDIVMLCVDNHSTRKLVDNICVCVRKNVCLISGGNDGIDNGKRGTYGNVQVYVLDKDVSITPSLSKYHPEISNPKDKHPGDKNCTELVTSVPQILFANLAVASAMCNALWLYLCGALHYSELCFDIADGLMRPVLKLEKGSP